MNQHLRRMGAALTAAAIVLAGASRGIGQTPEQEKAWAEDRARADADAKAAQERLAAERAARKADPMAWVRTLDPMTIGGWEFRSVASDGSWAVFSSTHQLKRSGPDGHGVDAARVRRTAAGDGGPYLSAVEKTQFDCKKQQTRTLAGRLLRRQQHPGQRTNRRGRRRRTRRGIPIVPGNPRRVELPMGLRSGARRGAR